MFVHRAGRTIWQSSPITGRPRSLFTRRKLVNPLGQQIRNAIYSTATVSALVLGTYYYLDSRAAIHSFGVLPLMHALTDPETSHELAISALSSGLCPKDQVPDPPSLGFTLWNRHFSNPIGLAAGLDKQGEAIDPLFDLGFSYVEIGTITPEAQPGNAKPRYFRLPDDSAVINRYGFNSDGHKAVATRLQHRIRDYSSDNIYADTSYGAVPRVDMPADSFNITGRKALPRSLRPGRVLAINLGKNKDGDEVADYVQGVKALGKFADVLVINVSSPNTPGLRSLQHGESLRQLLQAVKAQRDISSPGVPVCVKIAPDLTEAEIKSIAATIKELKVDGCIISNTTVSRPASLSPVSTIAEAGGLSGPPLKPLTMRALKTMRREVGSDCVLIACGGISSGKDVFDYGVAGASFVQGYTGFGYDGPRYARRLKDELLEHLAGRSWTEIVGTYQ